LLIPDLIKRSLSPFATKNKVSGLIDFGDMVRGPHICEVAIACAYIILDQDNPISILSNFVGSYHQKNSLTEDELELLFIFIKMRLAVSVVNSTLMGKNNPNDPLFLVDKIDLMELFNVVWGGKILIILAVCILELSYIKIREFFQRKVVNKL
jgi:hypothetical protein